MAKEKKKKKAATVEPSTPVVDAPIAPPVEAVAPVKPAGYVVAPGKSIACKKGILGPGDEVLAKYVGGADSVDRLVASGHVVEK